MAMEAGLLAGDRALVWDTAPLSVCCWAVAHSSNKHSSHVPCSRTDLELWAGMKHPCLVLGWSWELGVEVVVWVLSW